MPKNDVPKHTEGTPDSPQTKDTKTNIVNAAKLLTKEKGWPNVTVRDICTTANISIGTFYHYFNSKNEVVFLPTYATDQVAHHIFSTIDQRLPVVERFVMAFVNMAAWQLDNGAEAARYALIAHIKRPELNIVSPENLFYKITHSSVAEAQQKGELATRYSAEKITRQLHNLYTGIWVTWCIRSGVDDFVEQVDSDIRLLMSCYLPQ